MNSDVNGHTPQGGGLEPGNRRKAEAFLTLGIRAVQRGEVRDAADHFRRAVEADPHNTDAYFNLARALKELGSYQQAASALRSALSLQPDDSDSWYTLGNTYGAMQDHGHAEECYRTAMRLCPADLRAYNNCGVALQALGRTGDARDCYRTALAIDPSNADVHHNLALACLLDGQFEEGWKEFEWRFFTSDRANPHRRSDVRRWQGEDLRGRTILLSAEQGFGDTIQFLRFVPTVRKLGARVVLECQRELLAVARTLNGIDLFVERGDAPPRHDYWSSLMSLPNLLHVREKELGQCIPYLHADPMLAARWRTRMSVDEHTTKVGVVVAGNPRHRNDRNRSCGREVFLPLLKMPGVTWFDLQPDPPAGDNPAWAGVRGIGRDFTSFADTAAAIESLDLVFTVDTAVAHLAGALGKEVWLLLPGAPDWRWMLGRADSPWYPTMRLFRQTAPDGWRGVIDAVGKALAGRTAKTTASGKHQQHQAGRKTVEKNVSGSGNPWTQDADLALHYGDALQQAGLLEHAITTYQRAIGKAPDHVAAWNNLGVCLQKAGSIGQAVRAFDRAVALSPEQPAIINNLGYALLEHGDPDRARRWLEKGIALGPSIPDLHNNLGNVARGQGRVRDAVSAYRHAIELCPDFADAHWNLSQALLVLGEYAEGWAEYEWRWKRPDFTSPRREFSMPAWNGEEIRGRRILLHAEQGIGDAIQFVRYLGAMRSQGAHLVIECHPELVRLCRSLPDVELVIPHGGAIPPCDAHLPLMSLPRVMRTTLATIPRDVPYLTPPAPLVAEWGRNLGPSSEMRVGIVWSGARKLKALLNRSCPFVTMMRVRNVPGVKLVSLQMGDAARELQSIPRSMRPVDLTGSIVDFADTAAILQHLDLVISIDTAVAHLAGALGREVWTLLPWLADWRWLLDRTDSPWYPTMRLFRQPAPGAWDAVLDEICVALAERVNGWRSGGR